MLPLFAGWPHAGGRLQDAAREITSTPEGRLYADIVSRHFAEVQTLVRTNRRVAAIWRRSGGAELLNAVVEMLYRRDRRLPQAINGQSFEACLAQIQRVLMRYASPAFSSDLIRYAPRVARLSGMTYTQLLDAFEHTPPD
jgi:hypothetical protein